MRSKLDWIEDWEARARMAHYRARELARLCTVSDRQLRRHFMKHFGTPPQEWIDQLRMKESRHLLLSGCSVKEIAYQLGFKHPSRFCEAFKREHHTTPRAFFST